jgi:hypothetical protein
MASRKTLDRPIRWEAEDGRERNVLVGQLAESGLPAEIAEQLAEEPPNLLADQPWDGMRYTFAVVSETLRRRGDARGERLIDVAAERRAREGWNLAICLTDLPGAQGRPSPRGRADPEAGPALLVVPALKVLNPVEQVRDIAAGLNLEWAAGRVACSSSTGGRGAAGRTEMPVPPASPRSADRSECSARDDPDVQPDWGADHPRAVAVMDDGELATSELDAVCLEAGQSLREHGVERHGACRHIGIQAKAERDDRQRHASGPGLRPARRRVGHREITRLTTVAPEQLR